MPKQALIIIDLQNDYFQSGRFPLWNAEQTLEATLNAIARAQALGVPVILVQHVAQSSGQSAPFFNAGTEGVKIHSRLAQSLPDAPVVIKATADAFHETTLADTLAGMQVAELLICGMMTQNCVTHTAISKAAENYSVKVLADCSTSVSQIIHLIALKALSIRVQVMDATTAMGGAIEKT